MQSTLEKSRLVTYPALSEEIPSERSLVLRHGLAVTIIGGCAGITIIGLILLIGWLMITVMMPMFSPDVFRGVNHQEYVAQYIIGGLVATNCLTLGIIASWKAADAHHDLMRLYRGVPQGLVVDLVHESDEDSSHFGVVLEGHNRFNEIRRQTHWMDAMAWRNYNVGDYVTIK